MANSTAVPSGAEVSVRPKVFFAYLLCLYVVARIATVHEALESLGDFGVPGATAIVGPPVSVGMGVRLARIDLRLMR